MENIFIAAPISKNNQWWFIQNRKPQDFVSLTSSFVKVQPTQDLVKDDEENKNIVNCDKELITDTDNCDKELITDTDNCDKELITDTDNCDKELITDTDISTKDPPVDNPCQCQSKNSSMSPRIVSKSSQVDCQQVLKWSKIESRRKFRHSIKMTSNMEDQNRGQSSYFFGRRERRPLSKFNRRDCSIKSRLLGLQMISDIQQTKSMEQGQQDTSNNVLLKEDDPVQILPKINPIDENKIESKPTLYRRNVEYQYFRNNFIVVKADKELYGFPPCFVLIKKITIKTCDSLKEDTEETIMENNSRKRPSQLNDYPEHFSPKIRIEEIDITNDSEDIFQEQDPKILETPKKQLNNTKCLRIAERVKARKLQLEKSLEIEKNYNNNSCHVETIQVLDHHQPSSESEFTLSITGTAESIVDTIDIYNLQLQLQEQSTIRLVEGPSNGFSGIIKDHERRLENLHNQDNSKLQSEIPSTILPLNTSQTLPNGIQWKIADNYVYQVRPSQPLMCHPSMSRNDLIFPDSNNNNNKLMDTTVKMPYSNLHKQQSMSIPPKLYNHPIVPKPIRFGGNRNVKGTTLRQRLNMNLKDNEIFIPRPRQPPPSINTTTTTTSSQNTDWRFASYVALAQQRAHRNNKHGHVLNIDSSKQSNTNNIPSSSSRGPGGSGDNQKTLFTPELVRSLRQPLMHSKPFDSGVPGGPPQVLPVSSSTQSFQQQQGPQNMTNSYLEHVSREQTPSTATTTNAVMIPNTGQPVGESDSTCCRWVPMDTSQRSLPPPQSLSSDPFYKQNMSSAQHPQRQYSSNPPPSAFQYPKPMTKDDFLTLARRREKYEEHSTPKPMSKLERAIRNLSDKCTPNPRDSNIPQQQQQQQIYDHYSDRLSTPHEYQNNNISTTYHQYPVLHLNPDQSIENNQTSRSNLELEKILQYQSRRHHEPPPLEMSRMSRMPPPPRGNHHHFNMMPPQQQHGVRSNYNPDMAMNLALARMENPPPLQMQPPPSKQHQNEMSKLSQPPYLLNTILHRQQGPHQYNQYHEQVMNYSSYKLPGNIMYPPYSNESTSSNYMGSMGHHPPPPQQQQYRNSRLQTLLLAKSTPVMSQNDHHQYSQGNNGGKYNNRQRPNLSLKSSHVPSRPSSPETTVSRLLKEAEAYKAALSMNKGSSHSSSVESSSQSKLPDCPDIWGLNGHPNHGSFIFGLETSNLRSYLTRTTGPSSSSPSKDQQLTNDFLDSHPEGPELTKIPPFPLLESSNLSRISPFSGSEDNIGHNEDTGKCSKENSTFSRLSDDDEEETTERIEEKINSSPEAETNKVRAKAKQKDYIKSIFSDISSSSDDDDDEDKGKMRKSQVSESNPQIDNSSPQNNNASENSDLEFFCTDEDRSFIARQPT